MNRSIKKGCGVVEPWPGPTRDLWILLFSSFSSSSVFFFSLPTLLFHLLRPPSFFLFSSFSLPHLFPLFPFLSPPVFFPSLFPLILLFLFLFISSVTTTSTTTSFAVPPRSLPPFTLYSSLPLFLTIVSSSFVLLRTLRTPVESPFRCFSHSSPPLCS